MDLSWKGFGFHIFDLGIFYVARNRHTCCNMLKRSSFPEIVKWLHISNLFHINFSFQQCIYEKSLIFVYPLYKNFYFVILWE